MTGDIDVGDAHVSDNRTLGGTEQTDIGAGRTINTQVGDDPTRAIKARLKKGCVEDPNGREAHGHISRAWIVVVVTHVPAKSCAGIDVTR